MSVDPRIDRLYNLLPVVYRQKDTELGEPLRALLQVIAEQVNIVEDDIAQLYDNWFIETCQDWVVPYIADLIGYSVVHEAGEPREASSETLRIGRPGRWRAIRVCSSAKTSIISAVSPAVSMSGNATRSIGWTALLMNSPTRSPRDASTRGTRSE